MASLARVVPARVKRVLRRYLGVIDTARAYELVIDPTHRPLAGRAALVTGASGSIGRAIAIRLAAEGASVIAVARNEDKLADLVAEITGLGGHCRAESVDVQDDDAVHALVERVGSVDVLVNNAGGSARAKHSYIWEQSAETVDEVIGVNLRAVIMLTAAVGRGMVDRQTGGRIVNLGSTVGLGGLSQFSEYAAAKSGVAGFTRSSALEFGPHGVTVNCVTPGIVQRGQISQAKADAMLKKGVLPRIGRAEDIAEVVAFLAGPSAEWITGQEIVVDGGRSLGLRGEP